MTAIRYVLFIAFFVTRSANAQPTMAGLGQYVLGITTPDSLSRIDFREDGQSYSKGTIALPCTHIRTFTASSVAIGGIVVTDLSLAFYDNTLFQLSCNYTESLKKAFTLTYGESASRPKWPFLMCTKKNDKPMVMWGETWQSADYLALVVHMQGYNADCRLQEGTRLMIASQRFTALSSDCELLNANQYVDAYLKRLNDH